MAIRFESEYTSLAGRAYTLRLEDTNYGGASSVANLGEGGCVISYDADGDKKFNAICASTMEWTYQVETAGMATWIQTLINTIPEKTLYAYLYCENFDNVEELIWGGYVLMDLGSEPDESYPYEISLRAVDGLALLKEKKWLKTGASGQTHADTYIADGIRTFGYWISECLNKTDQHTTATGGPNWIYSTSDAWYNAEMNATALTDEPLDYTYAKMDCFYKLMDNSEYDLLGTTYDVLEAICLTWGMRVVYWQGCYHFIQLNEYHITESGSYANPINIFTRVYAMNGALTASNENLGNTYFSRYDLALNTAGPYASVGLQKLAGSEYTYLPAIKTSIVEFEAIENVNYFVGYPDMLTEAELIAHEAGGGGGIYKSKTLGTYTNAHQGSGWYMTIVMDLQMNQVAPSVVGGFLYQWSIRARQAGTSTWTYSLKYNTSWVLVWSAYVDPSVLPNSLVGLLNYGGAYNVISNHINIPNQGAAYSQTTTIFDSGQTINGKIPQPSWTASGDWEFEIFSGNIIIDAASSANGQYSNSGDIYRGHGNQCVGWGSGGSIPGAFAHSDMTNASNASITYSDNMGNVGANGQLNFTSQFSPIVSAANSTGVSLITTFVTTTTTDTHTNRVSNIRWGDTPTPYSAGAIQVLDKTSGLVGFPAPTGLWDRGIAGGTNTMAEQLAINVIENQYHSNPVVNGEIALGLINQYNSDLTTSYLKYINPICRIKDRDDFTYVMMRAAFTTATDTWNGSWWRVLNANVSTTTTTTGGSTGGGSDDDAGFQSMQGNPNGAGTTTRLMNPNLGPDNGSRVAVTGANTSAGTINLIPISAIEKYNVSEGYSTALKKGMKLSIYHNRNFLGMGGVSWVEYVTLSADLGSGDTEFQIENYVLAHDIAEGSPIYLDTIGMAALTIGEESTEWTMRVEGTELESAHSPEYILNGEDDTRSGRMGTINALAPTHINAQQSLKSGAFLCDSDYTITSARMVVSGTLNVQLTMVIYKTTPINGSNANTAIANLAEGAVTLLGDDRTSVKVLTLNGEGSLDLVAGDLIIPSVSVQEGEEGTSFRGSISFTLLKR